MPERTYPASLEVTAPFLALPRTPRRFLRHILQLSMAPYLPHKMEVPHPASSGSSKRCRTSHLQGSRGCTSILKTWSKPPLGILLCLSTREGAEGERKHEIPAHHCCTEGAEGSFRRFPTCFAPA